MPAGPMPAAVFPIRDNIKNMEVLNYMEISRIKKILDAHSTPYYIKGGRIFADCAFAFHEKFEDVTGWSKSQLYAWLGY